MIARQCYRVFERNEADPTFFIRRLVGHLQEEFGLLLERLQRNGNDELFA